MYGFDESLQRLRGKSRRRPNLPRVTVFNLKPWGERHSRKGLEEGIQAMRNAKTNSILAFERVESWWV
jgi:hypothetical protein